MWKYLTITAAVCGAVPVQAQDTAALEAQVNDALVQNLPSDSVWTDASVQRAGNLLAITQSNATCEDPLHGKTSVLLFDICELDPTDGILAMTADPMDVLALRYSCAIGHCMEAAEFITLERAPDLDEPFAAYDIKGLPRGIVSLGEACSDDPESAKLVGVLPGIELDFENAEPLRTALVALRGAICQ